MEMYKKQMLILLLAAFGAVSCVGHRPVKECLTYAEAEDPAPDTTARWEKVSGRLHAAIGSIDIRYPKSSVPAEGADKSWKGSAWQGERLSVQLVLWSRKGAGNVSCVFSDFSTPTGDLIPASAAKARFVRYVLTDEFGKGCDKRKPGDYPVSLSADVLDTVCCFDLEPETTRPVWITIDVPPGSTPGNYTSNLRIIENGKKRESFLFTVEVLPRVLPPSGEWKFHLDLWQNPYAVARVEGVEPWSEAHWKALRPVMKMLAEAGQKVITTTLNKRPWGGQTEDAFGSMIGWTKKADGKWQYDYTIFDQWVNFMMDLGIRSQINCYSMVPWGNELYYTDELSGEEVKIKAEPGSKEYTAMWVPFLKDFTAHLEQKGWMRITRIAMDERAPEEMKAMLKLLGETAPGMGVSLADNHKSYKLYPDQLMDLCVAQGAVVEPEDLQYRRSKGYVTTWYVCCGQRFPNIFTFSHPAEASFIGWYTVAADLDGFLRWAYNSWVKEPLTDSRFRTWPAGDTYAVYPGGRSSIRFERLREGIQDAEKIRILRKEFENSSAPEAKEKLAQLNQTVALFNTTKNPENLEQLIAQGKQVLEKLSK